MSTDVKWRGLTSKKQKPPENRHIQAKKRLELDSAAVGSVSGKTVDRLASVKLPLYMLHTLGKVKNQEMPRRP